MEHLFIHMGRRSLTAAGIALFCLLFTLASNSFLSSLWPVIHRKPTRRRISIIISSKKLWKTIILHYFPGSDNDIDRSITIDCYGKTWQHCKSGISSYFSYLCTSNDSVILTANLFIKKENEAYGLMNARVDFLTQEENKFVPLGAFSQQMVLLCWMWLRANSILVKMG